jgi:hypothetical protein
MMTLALLALEPATAHKGLCIAAQAQQKVLPTPHPAISSAAKLGDAK